MIESFYQINKLIFPQDSIRWNNLLINNKHSSYLSSEPYVYTKKSINSKFESFVLSKNQTDIGGAHFIIKSSKYNLLNIGDVKTGLVADPDDNDSFYQLIDYYLDWAKRKKLAYISLNPWLPKVINDQYNESAKQLNEYLISKGFGVISQAKHSYWLDLDLSNEILLKNMKRGTRYRVNQGLRSEIETITHTRVGEEILERFWSYYENIGDRKKFNTYAKSKFKREIETLVNSDMASLIVLSYQGTDINYSMVSHGNIAFYMHGAININYKKLEGCPSPGQLAQWKMIMRAKEMGSKLYDMGFCPGAIPEKDHPRYNIWNFKYEFGGMPVEYLPIYGKILQPIRGRIFHFLNKKNGIN